jgi:hypothetical protein
MFNILDINCKDLIAEFAGFTDQWKHRFSTDVLPKIEKGWMEVGNGNDSDYEYIPCANCYMYAKSECGNGRFCMNCAGVENVQSSIVCFDQMSKVSNFGHFEDFETFKRYRDTYNSTIVRINERMLKRSLLFKKIQMMNLV